MFVTSNTPFLAVPTVEQIDAGWLTAVLAQAGVGNGSVVSSFTAKPIGTGQVGESVRFTLQWSTDDSSLPATVVGKFPSPDPLSRGTAALTRTYIREVGFYRDLVAHVEMPTPKALYVSEDIGDNAFVLLMSDVSPAEQGNQLTGCAIADAELAVDAIVGLHATTWKSQDRFKDLAWLDVPSPEKTSMRIDLYRMVFAAFVERYKDRMSADEISIGEWLGENLPKLAEANAEHDLCVAHNDYRLDNMLFSSGGSGQPLTVVDWQTVAFGSGPADVAYFLGAGLVPEIRRQYEKTLFDRYASKLQGAGVAASTDDLWRQYVLGSASGYLMAVTASQIVQQTERGDTMFVAMATRHADQMQALDLPGLLR